MSWSDELARFHEELVTIARSAQVALGAGDRGRLEAVSSRLETIAGRSDRAGLAEVGRWASALRERMVGEPVAT